MDGRGEEMHDPGGERVLRAVGGVEGFLNPNVRAWPSVMCSSRQLPIRPPCQSRPSGVPSAGLTGEIYQSIIAECARKTM